MFYLVDFGVFTTPSFYQRAVLLKGSPPPILSKLELTYFHTNRQSASPSTGVKTINLECLRVVPIHHKFQWSSSSAYSINDIYSKRKLTRDDREIDIFDRRTHKSKHRQVINLGNCDLIL
jgi:hypothetical protein